MATKDQYELNPHLAKWLKEPYTNSKIDSLRNKLIGWSFLISVLSLNDVTVGSILFIKFVPELSKNPVIPILAAVCAYYLVLWGIHLYDQLQSRKTEKVVAQFLDMQPKLNKFSSMAGSQQLERNQPALVRGVTDSYERGVVFLSKQSKRKKVIFIVFDLAMPIIFFVCGALSCYEPMVKFICKP